MSLGPNRSDFLSSPPLPIDIPGRLGGGHGLESKEGIGNALLTGRAAEPV